MKKEPTPEEIKKMQNALTITYEEEVVKYDRSMHEWVKCKVVKYKIPDIWEVSNWLALHPVKTKKWWQFWK